MEKQEFILYIGVGKLPICVCFLGCFCFVFMLGSAAFFRKEDPALTVPPVISHIACHQPEDVVFAGIMATCAVVSMLNLDLVVREFRNITCRLQPASQIPSHVTRALSIMYISGWLLFIALIGLSIFPSCLNKTLHEVYAFSLFLLFPVHIVAYVTALRHVAFLCKRDATRLEGADTNIVGGAHGEELKSARILSARLNQSYRIKITAMVFTVVGFLLYMPVFISDYSQAPSLRYKNFAQYEYYACAWILVFVASIGHEMKGMTLTVDFPSSKTDLFSHAEPLVHGHIEL